MCAYAQELLVQSKVRRYVERGDGEGPGVKGTCARTNMDVQAIEHRHARDVCK